MTKKYFLSFHTIFILDENIKWIEEFLVYYIHLGFDHFYLYDNDKSTGGDGTRNQNKYGFSITTESGQETLNQWEKILDKYRDYITYVKWSPLDENGEVMYGQPIGIADFVKTYGNETEWVAMLDFDEFLFSPTNKDIRTYLRETPDTVSCVKVAQKKFKDRFISNGLITQTYECVNQQFGFDWAPKNIFRCADFVEVNNIHFMQFVHDTVEIDPSIFRFNHYNLNEQQFAWMNTVYDPNGKYHMDGHDDSMSRYSFLFDGVGKDTFTSSMWETVVPNSIDNMLYIAGTSATAAAIVAWMIWNYGKRLRRSLRLSKSPR